MDLPTHDRRLPPDDDDEVGASRAETYWSVIALAVSMWICVGLILYATFNP